MAKYRCPHCGKIVVRGGKKRWIKSYCVDMDMLTRLQLVKGKIKERLIQMDKERKNNG